MYAFTQRLFPVPYEWGRLLRVVLTVAVLVGIAELVVPTDGADGLVLRAVLFTAYPLALFATGFFTPEERRWLGRLRHPGALLADLRTMGAEPAVDGRIPEVYEVERMDEDARN
jgi:UDP-N-acetylmuramyl pentapeptide phosphotransferase/UDP-N-acetylglucosamine-1-phosphate transferase